MPQKIYHSVNTFNAGEISELLFNREDISKYKSACRILENAFPLVEGGAKKMPGTYFAGPTIDGNTVSRLVSFQFSTDQGAVLEMSDGAIRIWEPSSPGTWDLGLVQSGGSTLQLVTPYTQADLFELDCSTQSADVLWIFHPNYPPACVERLGPNNWTYNLAPPGGPPVVPGDPAYRGTPGEITTGFDAIGVPILQATQAYPLVLVTDSAFNYGDRIYINECAGMVELNEGEFFVVPVLNASDKVSFTGIISNGDTALPGLILNVTGISSGTILVGMLINGPNVSPNTIITAYLSGSGGTGTYQVNIEQYVKGGTSLSGVGGYCYTLVPCKDGALWTGSIAGNVLTVTVVTAGYIFNGVGIYFPGVANGTAITGQLSGNPGGVGTYSLSVGQAAGSQNMSTIPVFSAAYLPYQGGGFAVKVIPFFAAPGDYPS